MTETPPPPDIRRIIGLVLIAVGLLWVTLSGLCSAGFFLMLFIEGGDLREALSILPMIVLIGGFSIGIGFVIYIVGRALRPRA